MRKILIIFIFLNVPHLFGSQKKLEKVLEKYWNSKKVSMNVVKTIEQQLSVKKNRKSKGKLYYSRGLLKIIFEEPLYSEVVIDSENIWVSQKSRAFGEEKWNVSRFKKSRVLKNSQTLLGLLFADKKILDNFKIIDSFEKDGLWSYVLEPRVKKNYPKLEKLAIVLNGSYEIELLRQRDNFENEVSYRLTEKNFNAKFKNEILKHIHRKNSELNIF